ncbi:MAG: sugar phosphate isomerase/epimerase family protein [Gemmataceae bacterium]
MKAFQVAKAAGFDVIHANTVHESWLSGPERNLYIQEAQKNRLAIDTMFVGFDGQSYADIHSVEKTVGILPLRDKREHRVNHVLEYSSFAKELGVTSLGIHLGRIPEDKSIAEYTFLMHAMERILDKCEENNQLFNLETGQEAPHHLRDFIQHVDRPNLGVNFDCGNFVLYGTSDPVAALDVLGPFVRGFHCKDGVGTTEPGKLGKEMPLGQGEVDFPTLLKNAVGYGFQGPWIIEREHGPNVLQEVQVGKRFLEDIVNAL